MSFLPEKTQEEDIPTMHLGCNSLCSRIELKGLPSLGEEEGERRREGEKKGDGEQHFERKQEHFCFLWGSVQLQRCNGLSEELDRPLISFWISMENE